MPQESARRLVKLTGKAARSIPRGLANERAQNSVELLVAIGTVVLVAAAALLLYSTSIAPAVLQYICSGVDTAMDSASTPGSCLTPTTS
jgi:hypothetical protein